MPSTFLSVVGAITSIVIAVIIIMLVVDFFLISPRSARESEENYEWRSLDSTGPFWWIPISHKRSKPVYSASARAHEHVRKWQFLAILLMLVLFAAAVVYWKWK